MFGTAASRGVYGTAAGRGAFGPAAGGRLAPPPAEGWIGTAAGWEGVFGTAAGRVVKADKASAVEGFRLSWMKASRRRWSEHPTFVS